MPSCWPESPTSESNYRRRPSRWLLPEALGTHVRVTNIENGRRAVVRLTDRGPFVDGRIIDLSYAAGRALGMTGRGVVRVRLEPVDGPGPGWSTPGRQVAWAPEGSRRSAGTGPER